MKKTKFITWWNGEFGWELMCWQGHLRYLANAFDITVITREGNEMLYDDFAEEILTFDFPTEKASMWGNKDYNERMFNNYLKSVKGDKIILKPYNIGYFPSKGLHRVGGDFHKQIWRQYTGSTLTKNYDVLVHCRERDLASERNWGRQNWSTLIGKLKSDGLDVASIGKGDASFHSIQIDNYPDLPLEETVSLMNRAGLVVGESSGAMHLAALAGTPTIVWGSPDNKIRYEHFWNPLQFQCDFLGDDGWNPEIIKIYKLIKNRV